MKRNLLSVFKLASLVLSKQGPMALMKQFMHAISTRLKYRFSGEYRVVRIGGYTNEFQLTDRGDVREIEYIETHEANVILDLVRELRSNDTMYDVGANLGVYSCFAAEIVGSGDVVAFEPHPINAAHCLKNIERNGHDVNVVTVALSDDSLPITQLFGLESTVVDGSPSLYDGSGKRPGVSVGVATIDVLVSSGAIPAPTVMKIDVEGAEWNVLKGATETLENCRVVYVEIHGGSINAIEDAGKRPENVKYLFISRGFAVETLVDRDSQQIVKATRD